MTQDLYHRAIFDAAAAAVGSGDLPAPRGRGVIDNPLCGDRVRFDVRLVDGRVTALAHRVRGCLLCEAAASIIGGAASGLSPGEVAVMHRKVAAMLDGRSEEFHPPWEALALFAPASDYRSRHRCVTLAFDAFEAAVSASGSS